MARRDRRAAPARACEPRRRVASPAHRAGRAPDRGVRAPARHRPEDRPAADVPPAPRARRGGARRWPRRSSPSATRSSSASAASTSATRRSARSAAIPAATTTPAVRRRGAARRPRPRADRRVQGPATTSSTARSRRSTGSAPTGCGSASCSPAPTRPRATASPFEEVILATNPTLEGEATAMYLAERLEGDVGVGHAGSPAGCRSAATSSTPTRSP